MSDKLVVKYVPIDSIVPWDKNPKQHNREAIKKSIETFKPTSPILVQKKSKRIIAGHGRLEAFKELGYEEIPVIELDMNDSQAKAYALVDNQTTINAGWDEELLAINLDEIELEMPELRMEDFGFLMIGDKMNDPYKEWKGMPEYINKDETGRQIIVHFQSEKAVEDFAKLVQQNITPETKYINFPHKPKDKYHQYYESDEE